MLKKPIQSLFLIMLVVGLAITSCKAQPTPTPTAEPSLTQAQPTGTKDLPTITASAPDRTELPRYETVDITVTLKAQYQNPYDLRQVSLDGLFSGPDGKTMKMPGFWDGDSAWHLRFTPSQVGQWTYQLTVTDPRGTSLPAEGTLNVTASDLHGWLQAGNWVDPAYSGHYLVYQDGTPFYGIGHCDALNILIGGFSAENGVGLFDQMKAAGENYVVWWPLYTNSPITSSYDEYTISSLKVIDAVVNDAQKKGIFLVFTIWDHPDLRDENHPGNWGTGNWSRNGFNRLGNLKSFFTSAEAWAWQENFYRYIIARWSASPAIGMWLTVSEINGTNVADQRDTWHTKVNNYFVQNDPYRHLTTASQSGGGSDIAWPEGHKVMDAPQVHIYDPLNNNPVGAASVLAQWTSTMWNEADKPNWVGEFGTTGNDLYPELYHNSIWAALAAGASMTPAEWNSGGAWAEMTPEMLADLGRLGQFVSGIPLAKLNPSPLKVTSKNNEIRGWGVAGQTGGLLWVQDFTLEGKTIDVIRAEQSIRHGVEVSLEGLAGGAYTITPFDTWKGQFLTPIQVTCTEEDACAVSLPDFKADIAFKIERK
jgi:hypothetical protein